MADGFIDYATFEAMNRPEEERLMDEALARAQAADERARAALSQAGTQAQGRYNKAGQIVGDTADITQTASYSDYLKAKQDAEAARRSVMGPTGDFRRDAVREQMGTARGLPGQLAEAQRAQEFREGRRATEAREGAAARRRLSVEEQERKRASEEAQQKRAAEVAELRQNTMAALFQGTLGGRQAAYGNPEDRWAASQKYLGLEQSSGAPSQLMGPQRQMLRNEAYLAPTGYKDAAYTAAFKSGARMPWEKE